MIIAGYTSDVIRTSFQLTRLEFYVFIRRCSHIRFGLKDNSRKGRHAGRKRFVGLKPDVLSVHWRQDKWLSMSKSILFNDEFATWHLIGCQPIGNKLWNLLKSILFNNDFVTWHLIGCQQIGSQLWNFLFANMHFITLHWVGFKDLTRTLAALGNDRKSNTYVCMHVCIYIYIYISYIWRNLGLCPAN